MLDFPGSTSSYDHLPGQRLPSVHGNNGTVALWYHPGRFCKLDAESALQWLDPEREFARLGAVMHSRAVPLAGRAIWHTRRTFVRNEKFRKLPGAP